MELSKSRSRYITKGHFSALALPHATSAREGATAPTALLSIRPSNYFGLIINVGGLKSVTGVKMCETHESCVRLGRAVYTPAALEKVIISPSRSDTRFYYQSGLP